MEQLVPFVEQYGYWFLLGIGFIEYAGFPVASIPVLLVAGAMAAMGSLHPVPAVLATATGGLMADALWYALARRNGARLVGRVCALTTNPRACIRGVTDRVGRVGPLFFLPAKFIPGTGNLVAAAAGFAGVRPRVFLALDAVAVTLWAAVYIAVGWIFASRVEVAVGWMVGIGRFAAVAVVVLVAGAVVVRVIKTRAHQRGHTSLLPDGAAAVLPVQQPTG